MSDCSRLMTSAESPAVGVGPAGKAVPSWSVASGMDQITVVRIDDTHIEEQSHDGGKGKAAAAACYEMEYSVPAEEEEEEEVGEEEEDGVYVIEYSNPEEEGESYQFTMSVDRSLPDKKTTLKHPTVSENARTPSPAKPSQRPRQKRKLAAVVEEDEEEEEEVRKKQQQHLLSNKCVLELGEDYRDAMGMNSGSDRGQLVCTLCPPPGRSFKRASGLAVHLKHMHLLESNKTFFCTSCQQTVRTQIELDAHTRRHANQSAVFTCLLCPKDETGDQVGTADLKGTSGYKGSKRGLRNHLEQEHPGVVPRCDICNKGFQSLASYLADQFRHVGRSPYFCTRCQIYEMTKRGLTVHIRNHDKRKKQQQQQQQQQESGGNQTQTFGVADIADNSATDDSDF
ncbi:zinc finger and BTB domain-containing protein 47-like [Anoplopoma fimbria]|uniref:zinc finger and BTB domain-containing protein 47-like n=1 Tax=Anoplopoma fimbria TaxID=229290 RepID=UPI0023EC35A4|nr:zinc finger and BTB domain-containing protein 47-like [Anoplopoma fimbria]